MVTRYLLVFILSLLSATSAWANNILPDHIAGALCVVRADNQIVLVDELITGHLSLPGGTVVSGEPPAIAAQRETWEEAGLSVTVGDVLGYTDSAVVYDCISDSEVISYQARNELGGFELPIWFAPHYGVEVSRAMLLPPTELEANQYRYPEQWSEINEFFLSAKNQPVTYVTELVGAAPKVHQAELNGIVSLQNTFDNLPNVFANTVLLTDLLAKPWIFIVILPLVAWHFGRNFALKFGFTLISVTLLTLIAHQGFGFPRPHAYLPTLKLVTSSGYSFPSLLAALWVSLTLLVCWKLKRLTDQKSLLIVTVGLLWIMLFKTYSGSAFFSDVLMGGVLGALTTWHIVRLDSKPDIDISVLLSSKSVWWGLCLLSIVLTVIWPLPTFTFWVAILMTIACLVTLTDSKPLTGQFSFNIVIGVIVMLLAGNLLISWAGSFVSFSGLASFVIETLRFPLLILLGVVAFRLPWKRQ
ncbi:bifunctional NUDIX hydrolase/phosphatase PAP2 family protein [Vibrio lentus]|uniref:bifunctional NUDIX hydrolase/phosphatase PAP2 family protein n=2 Tax=Vibrio lentus TaxID=136468 RepID=UPI000C82A76B|nr:phosphatase PAP2 family protein [Vibrio lentus]PMI43654.1 DNA mismatch repair protein MutT [Vibrio lentus]PMJ52415.1 DNA mismatch repair protein MutT [Vibrio lentus]PMM96332.1 DNA mismatch repair protein MutT [Vibrio lentus]